MNRNGPYRQRIELRAGTWFARTLATAGGEAADRKSEDAEALFARGNALREQRRYDEALTSYDQALALAPDHAEALLTRGNALQALRRSAQALASYDKVVALRPDHADAFYNRAIALNELKRLEEAVASYDRAIALRPDYVLAFNNRGNALQVLKRFEEAVASYDRAIALKPDYADAFYNRGLALQALRRFAEALASYDRTIALAPPHPEVFNNRGNALAELERPAEALTSFDRALALSPSYAEAFSNRANALRMLDRCEEALASFDRALAIRPDHPAAFFGRGVLLQQLERLDEALASFDRAIALKPDNAAAFTNRGNALQELRRFDEALASYADAIALKQDYAEAYYNRALALQQLERFEEALASYDQAIAIKPDYPEAFNNRGHLLKDEGRQAEAVRSFERALALRPDYPDAKLALCMAQLPILYEDESEIMAARAAYGKSLEALRDDVERRKMPREWAKAVGSTQPFLLAYQGHNDRDLAGRYGPFMCRIMAERYPAAALASPPRPDERMRVGIVSGFFWRHSVWKIPVRGWLSQIDRRRFQVFGYHTGAKQDACTREAAGLCDRFVQGPLSIERWRDLILADAPHVLIHPDIGMNAVSAQLAAQRLAAVQCTSWGHPDTSGFPTIDYFLSSALMEPPEAQEHYTERLVPLPNLSIYYEPPELQPVALARADVGLRAGATLFWCGQSLFKYLPQFDQVFARIARDAGDCQFAFIRYGQGTYLDEKFLHRLERAFAAVGLKAADHCVLLPRLDPHRFVAAIGLCDIVLDSIGWSGCNSTLEGLHHDLPIVTMKGSLMRGRHTAAILKRMEVEDTVTETPDDYVAAAVRLARDLAWRQTVKTRISQNKHRLNRDTACISALETFLESVVRRAV
ncbi:MAG TPA: tetratricopeptide repeat protein [Xanthobacteraceae bacterium]|jgi:predicted O-linked N-acetylglucosamine transferase (SPINDLY family)